MKSIIVDLGSSTIKIGYNNEDVPKFELPSYIGETHEQIVNGEIIKDENKTYISSSCDQFLDNLKLYYPIKNGSFTNKDDIQLIFNFIYKQLDASPEEISSQQILITQPLFSSIQNKKNISEFLFETLKVPSLFFGTQPVLSLLGTGRSSGTILESGDNITQCCIVKEGCSLPNTFIRNNYGGEDLTEYFQTLLQRRGYFYNSSSSYLLVKKIKEKFARTKNYKGVEGQEESDIFNLPDGTAIRIGDEKKNCTDLLFDLSLIGKNYSGMDKMIYDSINSMDIELRIKLFGEILLSGGNTSIKGFPESLHKEIKKRINKHIKVRLYTPKKPQYCSWVGGKAITLLEDFKNMWITKAEWEEKGDIVFKEKTI